MRVRLTYEDVVAYVRRVEQRCEIELGFGFDDSCFLWPAAVAAIIRDELIRLQGA